MAICEHTGEACNCTGEGDCPYDEMLDEDFDGLDDGDYEFEMAAACMSAKLDGDFHV